VLLVADVEDNDASPIAHGAVLRSVFMHIISSVINFPAAFLKSHPVDSYCTLLARLDSYSSTLGQIFDVWEKDI
jgi:hypothetical protein